MKFYTKIPPALDEYFKDELVNYRFELENHNLSQAWIHLQRAHIIWQRFPLSILWYIKNVAVRF